MVPHGMVSLYVNVEAGPRGGICFVPTHDNTAVQGSVQVSGSKRIGGTAVQGSVQVSGSKRKGGMVGLAWGAGGDMGGTVGLTQEKQGRR